MRSKRFQIGAVMLGLTVVLGGCSMLPNHRDASTTPPPGPMETFSNEDTMKQVIGPAKEIVKVAALQDVSGGFAFEVQRPG